MRYLVMQPDDFVSKNLVIRWQGNQHANALQFLSHYARIYESIAYLYEVEPSHRPSSRIPEIKALMMADENGRTFPAEPT